MTLLLIGAFLLVPVASASAPTNIQFRDSGASTSSYERFHVVGGDNSYVFLGSPMYANRLRIDAANSTYQFKNANIGSQTNPSANFQLKIQNGNATWISYDGKQFRFKASTNSAGKLYLYGALVKNVTQVEYSLNNIQPTVFQQGGFFTSFAQWSAASTPSVFYNSTGDYLEVAVPSSSYVYFDLNNAPSVGGGPSNGGSSGGGPTTTTQQGAAQTSGSINPGSYSGLVAFIVILLIAAFVGSKFTESKGRKGNPWKSPKHGGPR
ncbi:MAG: hypothetical protein KGI38_12090 [Thaumarchaeota archaeon]|nr:hypothetical protein [Nitrososphaerota archaeon]